MKFRRLQSWTQASARCKFGARPGATKFRSLKLAAMSATSAPTSKHGLKAVLAQLAQQFEVQPCEPQKTWGRLPSRNTPPQTTLRIIPDWQVDDMAQNLPAPCFQVYAASVLASRPFRQADLAVRGLIHTMELECWVNHRLPHDPADLAKFLGIVANEINAALPAAMAFFNIDGEGIYSPRLEDYRQHLNEIRDKQKTGGKKGAEITNKKNGRTAKPADIELQSNPANPQVHPQVEARVSSKAKSSTVNQSQTQPLEKGITPAVNSGVNAEWLAGYETAESCTPEAYARESGAANHYE